MMGDEACVKVGLCKSIATKNTAPMPKLTRVRINKHKIINRMTLSNNIKHFSRRYAFGTLQRICCSITELCSIIISVVLLKRLLHLRLLLHIVKTFHRPKKYLLCKNLKYWMLHEGYRTLMLSLNSLLNPKFVYSLISHFIWTKKARMYDSVSSGTSPLS